MILDIIQQDPMVYIPETICCELGTKRVGEKLKVMINYQVIEKTKHFTVLKIGHVQLKPTKRIY